MQCGKNGDKFSKSRFVGLKDEPDYQTIPSFNEKELYNSFKSSFSLSLELLQLRPDPLLVLSDQILIIDII